MAKFSAYITLVLGVFWFVYSLNYLFLYYINDEITFITLVFNQLLYFFAIDSDIIKVKKSMNIMNWILKEPFYDWNWWSEMD